MKQVLKSIWQFLEIIGQHRYETAKRRGYGMY
jgi:hypothetical protein